MRRTIHRLTASQIIKLTKIKGQYADGGGLYLRTHEPGIASWIFRFTVPGGRERYMGLGPVKTVSLAEAREKALACRKQRLDNIDPIEERRLKQLHQALETARSMTFAQCAQAYAAAHRSGWKSAKHAKQWLQALETHVFPVFGDLPVQAIDVALVMKALGPMWNETTVTASRIRGRIESVLDWATTRGYREGENPARWRGHLENLLPAYRKVRAIKHHAALPYTELPQFMAELRRESEIAARELEFIILTICRSGEVHKATWPEIDSKARLWVVPAEHMKAGREHRVPLSTPAARLLEALERDGPLVFHSGERAAGMLLTRMRPGVTVHGFRSTFSDWCAEQTSFPSEVREMALAHAVGSKVEAAYRRGDLFQKRVDLMAAWATYCGGEPRAEVVPMRRAGG